MPDNSKISTATEPKKCEASENQSLTDNSLETHDEHGSKRQETADHNAGNLPRSPGTPRDKIIESCSCIEAVKKLELKSEILKLEEYVKSEGTKSGDNMKTECEDSCSSNLPNPTYIENQRNLFETVGHVLKSSSFCAPSVSLESEMNKTVPGVNTSTIVKETDTSNFFGNLPKEENDVDTQVPSPRHSETMVTESETMVTEPVTTVTDTPRVRSTEPPENTPYVCKYCKYNAPHLEALEKHTKRTHDYTKKKLGCAVCTFKYTNRESALEHYKSEHPKKKILLCDNCKYVTSDKTQIDRHIKNHFLERPFICGVCYVGFAGLNSYRSHMITKHTSPERELANFIFKKRNRQSSVVSDAEKDTTSKPKLEPASDDISDEIQRDEKNPDKNVILKKRNRQSSVVSDAKKGTTSKLEPASDDMSDEIPRDEKTPDKPDAEPPYYILPTKRVLLDCAFCGLTSSSKHHLATHLLSVHKNLVINFKDIVL